MPTLVTLGSDDKNFIINELRSYMEREFGVEIGRFDAEFFLDHITATIAPFWYNRGLADAHAVFSKKLDDVGESLYAMEMPTPQR
jgi:uncharacterized protein (DUF2164 family)